MSAFLDVTVQNYGSFCGPHPPFRLESRGLCLILGDNKDDPKMNSNGSGKSMIPDAVDWCLTGVVPRGDVADSVINEKTNRDTKVTVRVRKDDGVILTITRCRKVKGEKDGLRFWVGDEELTTHDTAETQRRLETQLGMDRSVFHSAVLFAQFDEWKFADATDVQRKALLSKIIPELAVVDEWLCAAKLRLAEATEQAEALQLRVVTKKGELDLLPGSDPRPLASEWDAQHAADLSSKITEYQQGLQALAAELQVCPALPVPPPPQPAAELARVNSDLAEANDWVNTRLLEVGAANSTIGTLQQAAQTAAASGTCPTCGQPVTPDHPPDPQVYLDAEGIADLARHRLVEAQATTAQIATHKADLDSDFFARTQQHQEQLRSLAAQNDRHARLNSRYAEVQRDLNAYQTAQQQPPQVNPYQPRIDAWLNKYQELSAEVDGAQHELAHLDDQIPYYKFWVEAFGPRGIKSHILDSRLQEMTDEANRWVSLLTGGTIWVRFETQTKTGKGKSEKLVDKFAVRVFRHNPDGTQIGRNYRSWCGGEKARVGSGIDFGLARLVANRAEQSYDMLFLDEIFGKHLDQSGKEAVAEMLQALSAEKSSIFVIDHDPRFQGTFAETIVVQKHNGESRILEAQA